MSSDALPASHLSEQGGADADGTARRRDSGSCAPGARDGEREEGEGRERGGLRGVVLFQVLGECFEPCSGGHKLRGAGLRVGHQLVVICS